jgi:2-keto-4-pentenoate hydratase/2-oxohepta-3-ene-1,7-dioic acid hydratase in catechol pathway
MKFIRFKYFKNIFYGLLSKQKIQVYSDAPWNNGKPLEQFISIDDVNILSPCQPGKVIATAINYPGATGLTERMDEPLVFIKPSSSVIGPNEKIISPFKDTPVWGEPELAVVIGKRLSKANATEAQDAILGYTIANDVSCENVNEWDHHLARSKGADTFCVLGPWIDTEYNPEGKQVRGYHNNVLIRDGFCQERLWKEPELLVWLSSWMTLEPGDVLLTGTPSRVIDRVYFKNNDIFTCEIEGLGKLSNSFILI